MENRLTLKTVAEEARQRRLEGYADRSDSTTLGITGRHMRKYEPHLSSFSYRITRQHVTFLSSISMRFVTHSIISRLVSKDNVGQR